MMKHTAARISLGLAAILAPVVVTAAPAVAEPSCVAQSVATEHAVYGSAWGHDLIAFLATHPEVLQQFGFRNLGELTRFAAAQDPNNCPPDL